MSDLLRHIQACNNVVLPDGRVPLQLAGAMVGWLEPATADRLVALGAARQAGAVLLQPEQLARIARTLAEEGAFRWRDEAFDVRADPDGPALAQLDRGGLPLFGVQAVGVHVNGLVEDNGQTRMWVARRAADKRLDPGKLDHLVAGGVPAGFTPAEALVKEAAEEAGVGADLARTARPVGVIDYAMRRDEGLRRDRLLCYDLVVPGSFTPEPHDGEVAGFELWDSARVLDTVRRTDAFKFNVNLVLIDLFLRRGLVDGDEAATLRAAL